MKNSKWIVRIALLLLICTMVLSAVACNQTPADGPGTDPVETDPETEPVDTMWTYVHEKSGVLTREITIQSGKGGAPVEIVQISDIHFNYCNEQDFAENDPVVMSTYENRTWLKNGASVPNAQRCINLASEADMLVLTGDTLDYLSHGCIELAKKVFFDPWEGAILATPGNHEPLRQMQGTVDDSSSLESRVNRLKEVWPHDLYYASVVLGGKVMLIQLDNSTSSDVPGVGTCFYPEQVSLLRADLEKAREKGYVVLLFYHIPIATGNAKDYRSVSPYNGEQSNFYSSGIGRYSTGASKEVYTLITNNADIIKGAFCGHVHNDYYTNIKGTGQNGTGHLIPQYIMRASAYESGHMFRIIVE